MTSGVCGGMVSGARPRRSHALVVCLAAAILAAAVALPGSQGAAQPPALASPPAWRVGDAWMFRMYTGAVDTLRVVSAGPRGYAVLEQTSGGSAYYGRPLPPQSIRIGSGDGRSRGATHVLRFSPTLTTEDDSVIAAKSLLRPQWPLDVPRSWTYAFTAVSANRIPSHYMVTYSTTGAMTSMTVPAGTFQAVRVQIHELNTTTWCAGDAEAWYAPSVRWFVKITKFPTTAAEQRRASARRVEHGLPPFLTLPGSHATPVWEFWGLAAGRSAVLISFRAGVAR